MASNGNKWPIKMVRIGVRMVRDKRRGWLAGRRMSERATHWLTGLRFQPDPQMKPQDPKAESITFGVELETTIPAMSGIVVGGYHFGSAVTVGAANGTTQHLTAPTFNGNHWKAERDGSIRANPGRMACEFVSPILQGGEGVEHLLQFVEWANAIGANVNGSCGCHITVRTNPDQPLKLLISGAPGIGKTSLVNMIARTLASHPVGIEDVNGKEVGLELAREWTRSLAYGSLFGSWSVKVVNELDRCSKDAQDMLLTYLDRMKPGHAFLGTTNLDLGSLTERFQTRFQSVRLQPP